MKKVDKALLEAVLVSYTPYIWGGDDPDFGLDCSGFVGYILRKVNLLPANYDDTAQGYYNRYKKNTVEKPYKGCLAFYGKDATHITHVMLIVNERACMGAVGGGRGVVTVDIAESRDARVDLRPIWYRHDLIAFVDPFKE